LGREATVFDIEPTFTSLAKALETGKGLKETIEVKPHLGKYHLTGHRNCNVCLESEEAKKLKNICPKCGNKLTVGVDQRIEELADRPLGYKPENAKPFKSLIPLSELLAQFHKKTIASKSIWEQYWKLVNKTHSEIDVLLTMPVSDIAALASKDFAAIVEKNGQGCIKVKGGYDGVYGVPLLDENAEQHNQQEHKKAREIKKKQTGLQDFLFS